VEGQSVDLMGVVMGWVEKAFLDVAPKGLNQVFTAM
jgi:hypothetical protein